jgi:hypothetical protein
LLPATWRKFLKPLPKEGRYRPSPCLGVDVQGAAGELDVAAAGGTRQTLNVEHVVLISHDNRRIEYAWIES